MTRYVILGNGAAGVTAAEEIRARDPQGQIVIVSGEPYPMYSRPGLAYVLLGEVGEQQVIARKPEWYTAQHITLVFGQAVALDTAARRVHLHDGRTLNYDRLLIATGARAVSPPYPGANLDGVVYLDSLDGTKTLLNKMKAARKAVVIGGGITALELCEGLAHHGIETHYLVRRSSLWASVFNEVESGLLEARIKSKGVLIHYHSEIAQIVDDGQGRVRGVILSNGDLLRCDLVGVAIGVKPRLEIARGTPIKMDRGILVNEYLETSEAGVFAAGDCAQIYDRWSGQHLLDSLWPGAVASGRAAGANMAGTSTPYVKGVPFNACLLFGLHITAIGQIGGGRDDDETETVQHLSRGASQVWATRPHPYASAWSQDGPNTIRLILCEDRLVGALIVGQQTLADPLRDLIENEVDICPLRPYLQTGGPLMAEMIQQFWERRPAA